MKPAFRVSVPSDRPVLQSLTAQWMQLPASSPALDAGFLDWKYWQPRPAWPEARAYLLERDNSILAMGAAWPLTIDTGTSLISSFHLIDWAADPKSPGAGVSLMRRMALLAPVMCVFGGSQDARRMRIAMGFRPRTTVTRFARPLRPLRQALTHQYRNWRTPLRYLRNWRWSANSIDVGSDWAACSIAPSDFEKTLAPAPGQRSAPFTFAGSGEAALALTRCPIVNTHAYSVLHKGRGAGYFILTRVPGQARLVDACAFSGTMEDWRSLYSLACKTALDLPDVNEILTLSSLEVTSAALLALGFQPRRRDEFLLFDPQRCVPEEGSFHVQLLHGDQAFLHEGAPRYET